MGRLLALSAVLLGPQIMTELGCTALAGLNGYEVVGHGGGGVGGATGGGAGGTAGGGAQGGSGAQAGGGAGGGELADGEPCTNAAVCASHNCVDSLCCDTPCAGHCQACSAAKTGATDGACAPVPALTDPDNECTAAPALGCDGTATGNCAACGDSATPPGSQPCPAVCDGGCLDSVCTIEASSTGEFQNDAIDCPADYACVVNCSAADACRGATINCPEQYSCAVTCTGTQHKCETATVNCPIKGTCTVECQGGDTCTNAQVHCGANDCSIACPNEGNVPLHDGCGGCACSNTC
jgi:hypothetical protein